MKIETFDYILMLISNRIHKNRATDIGYDHSAATKREASYATAVATETITLT